MPKWSSWNNRVIDDRGVRHRERRVRAKGRYSFRRLGRLDRILDGDLVLPPAQRGLVLSRRVLRHEAPGPFKRPAEGILGGAVLLLVAAVDLGSSDDGLWVPLVILAGSLLFVGAMAKLSLWLTARERLALLSLPPCCLACGYELKGIAEADDGCTVCPECGGAWRLPLFTADQAK